MYEVLQVLLRAYPLGFVPSIAKRPASSSTGTFKFSRLIEFRACIFTGHNIICLAADRPRDFSARSFDACLRFLARQCGKRAGEDKREPGKRSLLLSAASAP